MLHLGSEQVFWINGSFKWALVYSITSATYELTTTVVGVGYMITQGVVEINQLICTHRPIVKGWACKYWRGGAWEASLLIIIDNGMESSQEGSLGGVIARCLRLLRESSFYTSRQGRIFIRLNKEHPVLRNRHLTCQIVDSPNRVTLTATNHNGASDYSVYTPWASELRPKNLITK